MTQHNTQENDTLKYVRLVRRNMFVCVALFIVAVVMWVISTQTTFWAGMVLGLFIATMNQGYTAYKVQQILNNLTSEKRMYGTGMVTRMSIVAVGALVVLNFPGYLQVTGYVTGLIIPAVFALGDAIYQPLRKQWKAKLRERGEK